MERPHPTPFDSPRPVVVDRRRNKEEMESLLVNASNPSRERDIHLKKKDPQQLHININQHKTRQHESPQLEKEE